MWIGVWSLVSEYHHSAGIGLMLITTLRHHVDIRKVRIAQHIRQRTSTIQIVAIEPMPQATGKSLCKNLSLMAQPLFSPGQMLPQLAGDVFELFPSMQA